jgi:hypothetical protein
MGLHQTTRLLQRKRNNQQKEETTYRMGKNIYQIHLIRDIFLGYINMYLFEKYIII